MLKIGFANQYYTLWDITTEPKYFTDSYGNHWLQGNTTHYSYLQNISKDLTKVKAKYPDLIIDEELKGKNRSWSRTTEEDLTPQILKFGKYCGKSIQEVTETDFDYILWLCQNGRVETRKVCNELPKVIEHNAAIEQQRETAKNSHPYIESGLVEVTFTSNPNKNVEGSLIYDKNHRELLNDYARKYFATATIGEGNVINVIFNEIKHVEGLYPYNMAVINGKAMKIKGKTIRLNLNVIETLKSEYTAQQIALVI